MSTDFDEFGLHPESNNGGDVEMIEEAGDGSGQDSRSIIKISFDLEKGSADNIEMAEELAPEEHFGASVAGASEGVSPSEEPEGEREGPKLTRSSLTTHTHSTDGGSPPTSQNKSQGKLSSNSAFNQGRWSDAEHNLFLEGIDKFGKDWKKVEEFVGTRSSTQARSHAQKVLPKMEGYKELASPKKQPAAKRKPSEVFASFEKNAAPVFRVEKDCTRIQARKRLFSTPQTVSTKIASLSAFEEAKSEAELLPAADRCPSSTLAPAAPELLHQPASAVAPTTNSFDYSEPPQRRFTMNPLEAAAGAFPAPRKRVQSDAPMLGNPPLFDLPGHAHHPMDDPTFQNPFDDQHSF